MPQVPQSENQLSLAEISAGEASNVPELREAVVQLAQAVIKLQELIEETGILRDERLR